MTEQRTALRNSLSIVTQIFNECSASYRILGSVLIVAHLNNLFRHIGDVDILLDKSKQACVFQKLQEQGFNLIKRRWGNFTWIEAQKEGYLNLTFVLTGKFTASYFSYRFLRFFELRIKNDYLQVTPYNFEGVTFNGIPLTSVIAGLKMASLNPKRRADKKLMENEIKASKIKIHNNIQVYLWRIKIPFLYDLFSHLSNIYGGARVLLGRKYEVWD